MAHTTMTAATVAATTSARSTGPAGSARLARRATAGADRSTVVLLSLAAFLVLLALLASQLRPGASTARARRVVVVRRVYRTTVIETIRGGSGGNSVSQSVSSSGSGAVPVAPIVTSSSR